MPAKRKAADEIAFPALLRAARNAYAAAIRQALSEAGLDDVPRNGIYVIGAITRGNAPLGRIIKELGVSKQAAGQLVDTLVLRGYLDRTVDAQDRRRLNLTLSARGRAAAAASRAAIERLDAALLKRVGADCVAKARMALTALHELSE